MSEVVVGSSISRIARIALLVSLALNVLLVAVLLGGVVGQRWHGEHGRGRGGNTVLPHFGELRSFTRALPAPRAAEFDQIMQARREAVRTRIVALMKSRRAVHAAIAAEPFERSRLDAAFERLRVAEDAAAQEAQALLADMLDRSTAQERAQLLELMPSRSSRRARHQHAQRDGSPDSRASAEPREGSPEAPPASRPEAGRD